MPPSHCALGSDRGAPERAAGIQLGFDPWEDGLDRNWKNLERFVVYSNEQGFTRRLLAPDELFVNVEA